MPISWLAALALFLQSLVDFKKIQTQFSRQYRDWRHSQYFPKLVDFKKKFQSHFSRQYRDWRHSQHFQSLVVFNRISRTNIVTGGTRNVFKAWSTSKKFQSHFSRQCRDWWHSHFLRSLVDFKKISIAFLAPISWPAALAASPRVGRLQKVSIAFVAPILWLAALASPSRGVQFFQLHSRLYTCYWRMYGGKW